MRSDELQAWEQKLVTELNELRGRRSELDFEIQRVSKKLDLVKQMVALDGAPRTDQQMERAPGELRPTPANVCESAKAILLECGHALHINDIHRVFLEKGYPIPGGGTPFNILVHLTNSKEFVRVARGTYALAGTVPEAQVIPNATRTAPRQRKRKRRSTTKKPAQSAKGRKEEL